MIKSIKNKGCWVVVFALLSVFCLVSNAGADEFGAWDTVTRFLGVDHTWTGTQTFAAISGTTITATSGITGPVLSTDYVYVPVNAAAMIPTTTNGAVSGSTNYGSQLDWDYMAFDSSTTEYAKYNATIPPDWDGIYCKVIFHWTAAENSSAADVVVWGVDAGAIGNDDALASFTYGQEVTVSDILLVDEGTDLQTTAATASVTLANYTAGDIVHFRFFRGAGLAADTMDSEDAWLFEATVIFKTHKIISAP